MIERDSLPVAGPDDGLTPAGMAQVMSEVLGRPVGFQQVPVAENKATVLRRGMSEAWAQGMVDLPVMPRPVRRLRLARRRGLVAWRHQPRAASVD